MDNRQIYVRTIDYIGMRSSANSMIVFYQLDAADLYESPRLSTSLDIFLDSNASSAELKLLSGRPVQPDISEAAFATARGWLDNCINFHKQCQSGAEILPPRVIDVGEPDVSIEPYLFLGHNKIGKWVTLSHCWGGQILSATTSVNLKQRLREITFQSLPATFRDAITVTRSLGYRYLWIDALCILQDSEADWNLHVRLMSEIYSNSVVTIAADTSSNSDDGILTRRESAVFSVPVPYRSLADDLQGTIYVRPQLYTTPAGPLQSRGWTLQEDILTPRTIYFTADQLVWQCRSTKASEREPTELHALGYGDGTLHGHLKMLFPIPGARSNSNADFAAEKPWLVKPDLEITMRQWYGTVNVYSKRELTVEDDRYPALAGIARAVHSESGFQYKAGLWLEDIHRGLLWSTNGSGMKRQNVKCPTWSWVGVQFPDPHLENCTYDMDIGTELLIRGSPRYISRKANVKDIYIESASDDIYGRIFKGVLTIEGSLHNVANWRAQHKLPMFYKQGERFTLRDIPDPRTEYHIPSTEVVQPLCELDHSEKPPRDWTESELDAFEASVWFLQIATWSDKIHTGCLISITYALILEPTQTPGEYKRRGVAQIPNREEMMDGWDLKTVTIV